MFGKRIVCLLLVLAVSQAHIVYSSTVYFDTIDFVVSSCPIRGRPKGFLNANLNAGTGGKYIYAVYTTTTDRSKAITNYDLVSGLTSCPKGYKRVWQNINEGASGRSLYLCIEKKVNSGYWISGINFRTYSNPLRLKDATKVDNGWYFWKKNFNLGAISTKYIYSFYKWGFD